MSWLGGSLLSAIWQPLQTAVRTARNRNPLYFSEKRAKGPLLRRYGYEDPLYSGGLLPRVNTGRKLPIPEYRPKNPWSTKHALFGQNDYIDILGPDHAPHPTKLLYNVPYWLRGFHGNEFQMLIRRRKFLIGTDYASKKPTKWNLMRKRIMYLYKYLNQKTKTPFAEK